MTDKDRPTVSVVMSIYNGAAHMRAAIDSVLDQTFDDFELILIDDASTDDTAVILAEYDDPRIRLVTNETNLGLTKSLNKGLDAARGRYVARMDADDVCLVDRFDRQVAALRADPQLAVIGGAALLIDETDRPVGSITPPRRAEVARFHVQFASPFVHPAVMMRAETLNVHGIRYDESLSVAQDYDIFERILAVAPGYSLSEPVLLYRTHGDAISTNRKPEQLAIHDRVAIRARRRWGTESDGHLDAAGRFLFDYGADFNIAPADAAQPFSRVALAAPGSGVRGTAAMRLLKNWGRAGKPLGWLVHMIRLVGFRPAEFAEMIRLLNGYLAVRKQAAATVAARMSALTAVEKA